MCHKEFQFISAHYLSIGAKCSHVTNFQGLHAAYMHRGYNKLTREYVLTLTQSDVTESIANAFRR